jgi:hypothetical protein
MIAIVNAGGGSGPEDKMGERNYEVRINHEVIATFRHRRADGLTACLIAAAKAVERKKWERVDDFLKGYE